MHSPLFVGESIVVGGHSEIYGDLDYTVKHDFTSKFENFAFEFP